MNLATDPGNRVTIMPAYLATFVCDRSQFDRLPDLLYPRKTYPILQKIILTFRKAWRDKTRLFFQNQVSKKNHDRFR